MRKSVLHLRSKNRRSKPLKMFLQKKQKNTKTRIGSDVEQPIISINLTWRTIISFQQKTLLDFWFILLKCFCDKLFSQWKWVLMSTLEFCCCHLKILKYFLILQSCKSSKYLSSAFNGNQSRRHSNGFRIKFYCWGWKFIFQ